MSDNGRRRTITIIIVILLIIALLLLLTRCLPQKPTTPVANNPATHPVSPAVPTVPAAGTSVATTQPDEVLTAATVTAPARVTAGAVFTISWTGPDNRGDYLTIVPIDSTAESYGNYQQTKQGGSLELTAPMQPGPHEVRYVTERSHTILGRAPIEVVPAGATVEAAAEVVLGAPFAVTWAGPDNAGDYITIVEAGAPDDQYHNYANTDKGSPLTLTAPPTAGDAEIRYIAGQGRRVLARRAIKVIAAAIALTAPAEAIAGTTIEVQWTGPNNSGDYITIVAKENPDGRYGNYTVTSAGSPLKLLVPIMAGEAELRYMTGQGNKVLGRRAITIRAAAVTLTAPAEAAANADVSIAWTGPNNPGDYITIVAKSTPDGQYAAYTITASGSPLNVKSPKEPCDAEVRYMTGQGNKVLARTPIKIVP